MIAAHDPETLAVYDREAAAYVGRYQSVKLPRLESFLDRLVSGAYILELGCGGGRDAERMIERGFSPTPHRRLAGPGRPGLRLGTSTEEG